MIGTVVNDLIETTRRNLDDSGVQSIDDVRAADKPLVTLSDDVRTRHLALKKFLNQHLYRHEKKLDMTRRAQAIVRELFDLYRNELQQMPAEFANRAQPLDEAGRARVVADYIAGMTDRYAIAEHERRFGDNQT